MCVIALYRLVLAPKKVVMLEQPFGRASPCATWSWRMRPTEECLYQLLAEMVVTRSCARTPCTLLCLSANIRPHAHLDCRGTVGCEAHASRSSAWRAAAPGTAPRAPTESSAVAADPCIGARRHDGRRHVDR